MTPHVKRHAPVQARLYPEDEVYELEPDHSVQRYEVVEHQVLPVLRMFLHYEYISAIVVRG